MQRREFIQSMGVLTARRAVSPSACLPFRPTARPPDRPTAFVDRWSWAMGQPVRIQLYADSEPEGQEAAAAALAELRRVESRLSLFDDASDLCELNRQAGRRRVRVGDDLLRLLRLTTHLQERTAGTFNVAVEPLMRAWGFRAPRAAPPGAAELAEARASVRSSVIRLDDHQASLPVAHTQLDLGGIGVGYGLDRAADLLRSRGIRRALIDVSGDLVALGAPPGETGWRIAIAGTRDDVLLRDEALATSANTAQVRRFGALSVGHVMDPAAGRPAPATSQVTVVAPRAVIADAMSTAALVGGDGIVTAMGLRILRRSPAA